MNLKYALEDRPPFKEILIYGLQWLAVTIPAVIILGRILGGMEGSFESSMLYMQKLFAVMGVSLLLQIWKGHRLPLVIGPATVLLIGILASEGKSPASIYTSIMIGGGLLFLFSVSGLFNQIRKLFNTRVVSVILLLVAFTMMPSIIQMISRGSSGFSSAGHLGFAFVLILLMFLCQRFFTGLMKSTIILWGMISGTIVYFMIEPASVLQGCSTDIRFFGGFFSGLTTYPDFDPGLIAAFMLCFLGLAVNDLGSIQAVGTVLNADEMPRRINSGTAFTGIGNVLAGFMGVIGPLNFSFSPGIIASTGCAARSTLIPAGVIMLLFSFIPGLLFWLNFIPDVVIGSVLLFIMCTQVAAGLLVAFSGMRDISFDYLLLIAFPVLSGLIIAFLPAGSLESLPSGLRPVLGNGFVVGITVSLVLEHLIFRSGRV